MRMLAIPLLRSIRAIHLVRDNHAGHSSMLRDRDCASLLNPYSCELDNWMLGSLCTSIHSLRPQLVLVNLSKLYAKLERASTLHCYEMRGTHLGKPKSLGRDCVTLVVQPEKRASAQNYADGNLHSR